MLREGKLQPAHSRLGSHTVPVTEVVWIRERFPHMGNHSGYDLLCETLLREGRLKSRSYWRRVRPLAPRRKKFLRSLATFARGTHFYNEHSVAAELSASRSLLLKRRVAHVLYAENNLGLLRRFKWKAKIIATVHQPAGWWTGPVPAHALSRWPGGRYDLREFFDRVDVLIALSTASRDFLSTVTGARVEFVPYGIDVDFFRPLPEEQWEEKVVGSSPSCLVVGHWLRDFALLLSVIERVGDRSHEITFDLVIPAKAIAKHPDRAAIESLLQRANVRHHAGLSDSRLRQLYQSANLLLLPLKEASANSALLEALASGLPIVASRIDGVVDYVDTECAALPDAADPEEMADSVLDILSSPEEQLSMGQAARRRAVERFSWERVAGDTRRVYETAAP